MDLNHLNAKNVDKSWISLKITSYILWRIFEFYNERNVVGVWFFGPKNAWLWESLVLNIKLCYRQNSTFEAFLIYFVKTGESILNSPNFTNHLPTRVTFLNELLYKIEKKCGHESMLKTFKLRLKDLEKYMHIYLNLENEYRLY